MEKIFIDKKQNEKKIFGDERNESKRRLYI